MTYEDVTPAPPSLIRLFSVFQCLSVAPFYNFLYNFLYNKKNSGHGPIILQGYGIAVQAPNGSSRLTR